MTRKRGRKSGAELATIPACPVITIPRPEPPLELLDHEADEWRRVVNCLPSDFFGPESHALLVQYCRHVTASRRIAHLLRKVYAAREYDPAELSALLREQRAETAIIKSLMTAMRLSQQSSYSARGAAGAKNDRPAAKPLWES